MSPEGKLKLRELLINHESFRQFPYRDTTGHLTIGFGRNLDDRGISKPEAYTMLDSDMDYFTDRLSVALGFFLRLDENRQVALVDLCFNVGLKGFLGFKKMIAALESRDYERAADEMMDSKWAIQVGARAFRLASIIRTGKI